MGSRNSVVAAVGIARQRLEGPYTARSIFYVLAMEYIERAVPAGKIEGTCDGRFVGIVQEFERNFRERGELGASVSVTVGGKTVVDLWGGLARAEGQVPWQRDTLSAVYSCTKGMTALCAHVLASRGRLDIDAPVAEYWPEFARNGKERSTVKMLLDHSVGVPAVRALLRSDGCVDWDYMTEMLANEEPFWTPGTRNGYHMLSFGWTVGEIVRRVSGKSLGTFFQDEIARPLAAEFWIGAPAEIEPRVAPMVLYQPSAQDMPSEFIARLMADPCSIQALSLLNLGGFDANSRACRAAEIGGAGGISNARGLARIYATLACGGSLGKVHLVDAQSLARMAEVAFATQEDATLLIPTRFALGFMKSMDNRRRAFGDQDSAIFSSAAFGHLGAGGSVGFADPVEGVSFGYTMNRMGPGLMLNQRGQALVDATYRALGYASNAPGVWTR
jgi:CubicO group peptidase (beta-lactamase class C family)